MTARLQYITGRTFSLTLKRPDQRLEAPPSSFNPLVIERVTQLPVLSGQKSCPALSIVGISQVLSTVRDP